MTTIPGSPIEDIAYLTRSEHRVTALAAMTVRPRSRSELWEMTGVSSSTIRRTIREFEDRQWIRRDGYQYEATELGGYIANAMAELLDRFETERQLRHVWQWLPSDASGFTLDLCTDATVTVADADDPYRPVTRFVDLLDATGTARLSGLDVALLEPCKDALCERILDGMNTEFIAPPRVVRYIRSTSPDLFQQALESGHLTVRIHDDLPPYGICLLDERVAIIGYDPDSLTVRVLVDTGGEAARDWARSRYQSYERQTPTIAI